MNNLYNKEDATLNVSEDIIIQKKIKLPFKILLWIFFIFILLFSWMHFIEVKLLFVRDVPLRNSKINLSYDGLSILSFSDIHFGRTINEKELTKVIDKINALDVDIVTFNGDLFDQYITYNEEHFNFLKEAFQKIKVKHKKYAIIGDKDLLYYDKYMEILNESGFTILDNTNEAFYYNNTKPIYIGGISTITKDNKLDYSIFKKDELQIILCHEPVVFDDKNLNYDYIFASHTLGGLIRLPFNDGLYKLPNSGVYSKGAYYNEHGTMLVSSGIGTQDFSLRLLNPPTIYLYRFFAKK